MASWWADNDVLYMKTASGERVGTISYREKGEFWIAFSYKTNETLHSIHPTRELAQSAVERALKGLVLL